MNTKHNVLERFESLVKESRSLVYLWEKPQKYTARVDDP